MELKTYYDFAENDYRFIKSAVESNVLGNSIGAIAQNTCERYLKHLIDTYIPVTDENQEEVTDILKTHNVVRLAKYWNDHADEEIDDILMELLQTINGLYFSTKYPGDDTEVLTEQDMRDCVIITGKCKERVDEIIETLKNRYEKLM